MAKLPKGQERGCYLITAKINFGNQTLIPIVKALLQHGIIGCSQYCHEVLVMQSKH